MKKRSVKIKRNKNSGKRVARSGHVQSAPKKTPAPALMTKSRRHSQPALTITQLAKQSILVKGNKHMTVSQAKEKRGLLLRLRERITGQINFLATDNISRSEKDNDISYRSEEQGTDNFDRDFALNRVSLDQDIMFEIDEALNRLVLGAYGICDSCGRGIEKARLKAVPYSRMCIVCQSKNESGRKKFKPFESAAVFHSAEKSAAESSAEEE